MKRLILSILLGLSAVFAMAEPDVKLRIGLMGGFNMTKWNSDFKEAYGSNFKPGFHAGAQFEIMINQRWSVQPSLLFCMEGTKLDSLPVEGKIVDGGVSVGAMGVKMPLDVMLSIHNVGPGRLVPSLGLYITGYIGGETEKSPTFGNESVFQKNWEEDKEQTKDLIPDKFDYGLSFKLMYECLKDPVGGLFVQAGFSYGFTGYQNMNIMVGVGYKFQYVKALRSAYNTGILEFNP